MLVAIWSSCSFPNLSKVIFNKQINNLHNSTTLCCSWNTTKQERPCPTGRTPHIYPNSHVKFIQLMLSLSRTLRSWAYAYAQILFLCFVVEFFLIFSYLESLLMLCKPFLCHFKLFMYLKQQSCSLYGYEMKLLFIVDFERPHFWLNVSMLILCLFFQGWILLLDPSCSTSTESP